MKIHSGKFRGRKLVAPKGNEITRPALEKVRAAIFSSLGNVTDFVVLDLYAGTGSLGLEALSRDAKFAYFVDTNKLATTALFTNIETLGVTTQCRIFRRSLPECVAELPILQPCNVIFCDPPYDRDLVMKTLKPLMPASYVTDKTIIVIEHSPREPVVEGNGIQLIKQRAYGQTVISYVKRESA